MRDRHRPVARSLQQNEREILENYFDAELLDAIRLKEVSQIEKPPFYEGLRSQLSFVGMRITFDFTNATGITFDNCVLLNQSPLTMDLLFHELVHAEQYRQVGCFAICCRVRSRIRRMRLRPSGYSAGDDCDRAYRSVLGVREIWGQRTNRDLAQHKRLLKH